MVAPVDYPQADHSSRFRPAKCARSITRCAIKCYTGNNTAISTYAVCFGNVAAVQEADTLHTARLRPAKRPRAPFTHHNASISVHRLGGSILSDFHHAVCLRPSERTLVASYKSSSCPPNDDTPISAHRCCKGLKLVWRKATGRVGIE